MPSEPDWLTADHVIVFNRIAVAATGERHFLRAPDLLESACARPANLWHYDHSADIVQLASSLLFGLARNHPFEQGNKRTAFIASIAFLELNGFAYTCPDDVGQADLLIRAIESHDEEQRWVLATRLFVRPA